MKLLNSTEVAEMLGVSKMTLKRWRNNDEGPAFIKMSRSNIRYKQEDVEQFIEDKKHART